jgi:hypothetical protein
LLFYSQNPHLLQDLVATEMNEMIMGDDQDSTPQAADSTEKSMAAPEPAVAELINPDAPSEAKDLAEKSVAAQEHAVVEVNNGDTPSQAKESTVDNSADFGSLSKGFGPWSSTPEVLQLSEVRSSNTPMTASSHDSGIRNSPVNAQGKFKLFSTIL